MAVMKTLLAVGAASLAAAVPLESRQVVPHYPPNKVSTGFRLVANVTDPATDLTPSVNGWELHGIHTGAGFNDAVLTADAGRVFYQNGTAAEVRFAQGSILSDGGEPPFPWGIYVQKEDEHDSTYPAEHDVNINVGSGTIGVSLLAFPNPYFYLTAMAQGTFVACPRTVPYYNQEFIVVRFAYDTSDPVTALPVHHVPEGCTAITLIPECDTLADLPEGSISSHEFARDAKCYEDVSAINWPEYGP
ncbi:hypothetical protein SAMD00023353_7500240 [Rosellinia necatrix]|uniref:DUF7907 domain-containing protein n=1 Tax=Rosellinia necatrix TaxID=77044 RepID=A0A1W2TTG4_ROSNE|nr:hypothetical protein SAMD00023353_7500240 [Rosellinia necatrix]